jgi:DNA end-binding protein Ku
MQDLLDAKIKNKKTPRVRSDGGTSERGENVVDLMSALKESLKETKSSKKKTSRKKAS